MNIKYEKVGDYLLPNLTLNNKNYKQINRYGLLRLNYIKQNRKTFYATLLMHNELTDYLFSVSKKCDKRFENLMNDYKKKDNKLSEEYKEINQLEWIKLMNNYRNCTEEIILKELICV